MKKQLGIIFLFVVIPFHLIATSTLRGDEKRSGRISMAWGHCKTILAHPATPASIGIVALASLILGSIKRQKGDCHICCGSIYSSTIRANHEALGCGHIYHSVCIREWHKTSPGNCPECRPNQR